MLREFLALDGVVETCELRSPIGIMAFHGGNLERVTDVIAHDTADQLGASVYSVVQAAPLRHHVPSRLFHPSHSEMLAAFLAHVDLAVAIHGYGRDDRFHDILLGGRHRELAGHLGGALRGRLPEAYRVIDDLDDIPVDLRGVHVDNPVNRPPNAGVQVELPPTVRWNREAHQWSDFDGAPRAPHVDLIIDGLVEGLRAWA